MLRLLEIRASCFLVMYLQMASPSRRVQIYKGMMHRSSTGVHLFYFHPYACRADYGYISRDPRSPAAPLRAHSYTHSDDITALHFLRSSYANGSGSQTVLLSISTDGLLSTSNAGEPDEDEAGLHVGNWGTSVAQAGWVNGRGGSPGVWASSDMETFSLWTNEVRDSSLSPRTNLRFSYRWKYTARSRSGCRHSSAVNSQTRLHMGH